MRLKKPGRFEEQIEELADFARALSHPARVAIVRLLMERGPLCCGALVAALPLAQATVSQHLRLLQRAHLVEGRAEGLRVEYRLEGKRLRDFCHAFQEALGTAGGAGESSPGTCSGSHGEA